MSATQRLGNGWAHDVGPTSGQMLAPNGWAHVVGPTLARSPHAIGWDYVGGPTMGRCMKAAVLPTIKCSVYNSFRQFNARYYIYYVVSDKPAVEGNASVRLLTSCVLFSLCAKS